jgi:hypothetical protein
MGRFKAGQSGNPGCRPRGSLNKATLAAQALLDEEAGGLTLKVVELAKNGSPMALRLCLERLLPPGRTGPLFLPCQRLRRFRLSPRPGGRC